MHIIYNPEPTNFHMEDTTQEEQVQFLKLRNDFLAGVPKQKKINVIMTWGKYKGKLVEDIIKFDEKYASWLYRQDFIHKFDDIYTLLDGHFRDSS